MGAADAATMGSGTAGGGAASGAGAGVKDDADAEPNSLAAASQAGCQIGGEAPVSTSVGEAATGADAMTVAGGASSAAAGVEGADDEANMRVAASQTGCQIGGDALVSFAAGGAGAGADAMTVGGGALSAAVGVEGADDEANMRIAASQMGCHIGGELLASLSAFGAASAPAGSRTGVAVAPGVSVGAPLEVSCATCWVLGGAPSRE